MLVVVGRLGRPHGIRGELTVEVRTDEAEARFAPGRVLLTEPESAGPLTVRTARWQGQRLLVGFEQVLDRAAAEALRGVLVSAEVDPRERPQDPEEYYDHQLVGLRVRSADGTTIGTVGEVLHLPGQDLLAVRREGAAEVLVPFVTRFVPQVDLAAGQLVLTPPPGLLEDLSEPAPDGPQAPDPAG